MPGELEPLERPSNWIAWTAGRRWVSDHHVGKVLEFEYRRRSGLVPGALTQRDVADAAREPLFDALDALFPRCAFSSQRPSDPMPRPTLVML